MAYATKDAPFERPVAPSERLYLAGLEVVPPVCLHVVVEGAGHLEVGCLRRAVAAAARVNPGCRLALRGSGKRLRWVAQPKPPPVIARTEAQSALDLGDWGWLREPIDPRFGATCSVSLLPGPRVVFRAFHGVMDGQGLFAWIQEVFRALRGQPLRGHLSPEVDTELASLAGPRPPREALSPDAPCALAPRGADVTSTTFDRRRLDGVLRLSAPTLALALAALHRDLGETRPLRLMVPVDLRNRAPGVASTGNLSLPIFLDVPLSATPDDVTSRMLASLAGGAELAEDPGEAWLARLPQWAVACLVRAVCWLGGRRQGFPATAILSHLGRLSLEEFSGGGLQAQTVWALPVSAGLVPVALTVVEHTSHVELTCCAPAHPETRRLVADLLDRVERAARAAQPPPKRPQEASPRSAVPEREAALESELRALLAEVSNEPDLSELEADMNVFELGIVDSLGFVKLIAAIEAKYDVVIQEQDYGSGAFFTLDGMAEWLLATRGREEAP